MHSVAAFFASIVTFVSGLLGSPLLASNSPVTVATTQPAAAQTEISDNPFNDPAVVSPAARAAAAASASSPNTPQRSTDTPADNSLSPQDAAEQRNGRVLGEQAVAVSPSFLSQFSTFLRSFDAYLASPLASSGTAYPRYGGYLPQSDGTTALAAPSITGGTITNASSGSFDALSAGTLALSGALSGTDATFSGTLTAGTLNVAGITSQGALIGPYVTATSTTATSTFAGGLTAANSSFNILQNGNVGIGIATPAGQLHILNSVALDTPAAGIILSRYQASASNMRAAGLFNYFDSAAGKEILAFGLSQGGTPNTIANTKMVIRHDGNVGIGTTTPNTKLNIYGGAIGGQALTVDNGGIGLQNGARIFWQDNTATYKTVFLADASNNLGIRGLGGSIVFQSSIANQLATLSDNGFLEVRNTTAATGVSQLSVRAGTGQGSTDLSRWLDSSGTVLANVSASGKLGVGIASPTYSVDVNGFVNVDGTAGGYKQAGNTVLYASSTNSSTLLGINAAPNLLSTALYNTALGREAMQNATSSNFNTAVGYRALKGGSSDSSGIYNTAVGWEALQNVTSGNYNAALGYQALANNQTGVGNVAFGANALAANTTASGNSAFGNATLQFNVSGANNTAIGTTAQNRNLTGNFNVAIGGSALFWNQSATNTVAVGYGALTGASGNYSNQGSVGVGYLAGYLNQTGSDYNTLIGYQAGYTVTTGQFNTILGYNGTSGGITSGSNNILIGKDVRAGLAVTSDNQLNIGNLIFGTGLGSGSTLSTGNVGIGTTTPTAQFHTTGTVRFSNFGAGTLTTDASGNLSVSSDERLKNIDGAFTRGLADVLQLSPIQYHWNALSGLDTSTQYAGFSAQNVQQAVPEAVGSSTNGYLTLQDRPLIATVVNAIKEIAGITGTFKDALVAWLGNAGNGIGFLFAADITATSRLCVSDGENDSAPLCLTKAQLAALLSANSGSQSINFVTSPSHEDDTSPSDELDTLPPATSTAPTTPPSADQAPTAPRASTATSSPPQSGDGPPSENSDPVTPPAPSNDNPPPTDNADDSVPQAEQQPAA